MNEQEFKDRTKKLALRIIRLVGSLPRTPTAEVIGKQLLRAGTSVGAFLSRCLSSQIDCRFDFAR